MSKRENLAHFVARTLDNAERSGATQTWVDLVDHGGGDGGGLEADSFNRGLMREDDMAGAIADGIAEHARNHPEDAARKIDGVIANQCLMATLGFASGYYIGPCKRPVGSDCDEAATVDFGCRFSQARELQAGLVLDSSVAK